MATHTISSGSADMTRLWPGTSGGTVIAAPVQTATQFRITVDLGGGVTYDLTYTGANFTYSGLTATGGTYSSIQVRETGGVSVLHTLSGLSQPLADIYTVSLETLPPLAGNDVIGGAFGNDTLLGGDGNDTITDAAGTSRDIRAGAGDDIVRLLGANLTGTADGGAGVDEIQVGGNLTGLTLSGFEILSTNASVLTGSAALFESFDTIRVSSANLTGTVSLILSASGAATVLNLTDELTSGAVQRALFITGSADAETITSLVGNDRLFGGGGNDVLNAGDGDNWLLGGDGDDVLNAGGGNDILRGEAGNDTITAGDGNDTISDAGGGASRVDAGGGNDSIDLRGEITTAVILGGDGNDSIQVGMLDANSTIRGGAGDDTVTAGGFAGVLDGGTGTDRFVGSADLTQVTLTGFEVLQGTFTLRANQVAQFPEIVGSIILAASGSPVVLDLSASTIASVTGSSDRETLTLAGSVGSGGLAATLSGEGGADVLTTLGGKDQLFGGDGNDTLNAGAGDDALDGGAGNDVLDGGDSNDVLSGGSGNDTLYGGAGNDRLADTFGGRTSMSGGVGDDVIALSFGGVYSGRISGGTGFDRLQLSSSAFSGFSENITDLQITEVEELETDNFVIARAAQLEVFDHISISGSFDSTVNIKIAATGSATVIDLHDELLEFTRDVGLFPETVAARGMRLFGSRDNETILSTLENDMIDGGGGRNTISYARAGAVVVDLSREDVAQDTGGAGVDVLSGFDNIIGSAFNDVLRGSGSDNVLTGGIGADTLTGGRGADRFVFRSIEESTTRAAGRDRITDFRPSQGDEIDLSAIDANSATAGNGTFTFVGAGPFTALGQVRAFQSGGDTFVEMNTRGGLGADMQIVLTGLVVLGGGDFVL